MKLKKIKIKGAHFVLQRKNRSGFFRILQRCNISKKNESHRGGNMEKCSNRNRI